MNYVVTQPPNSVAKPCGDVDPRIISEITDIVARLGCDSTAVRHKFEIYVCTGRRR